MTIIFAKGGENVIFFLIFGAIMVFKIIRGLKAQQTPESDSAGRSLGNDDEWDSWDAGGAPRAVPAVPARSAGAASPAAPQRTRAQPSPKVAAILQALEQQQAKAAPTAPPPLAPVEAPVGRRVETPTAIPVETLADAVGRVPAAGRKYLDSSRAKLREPARSASAPSAERRETRVAAAALDRAFPTASELSTTTVGARAPIVVNMRRKARIREGILMSEILGPPRGFDV